MEKEIRKELLDELIKDYEKPEDLIGETGLLKKLTKALMERALGAELTHHLGYKKHDPAGYNSGNSRNGSTPNSARCWWRHRETATGASSRKSCKSTRRALMASMRRFCRCMRGG